MHAIERINDYRYYEQKLPFNNKMAKIGYRIENFEEDDLWFKPLIYLLEHFKTGKHGIIMSAKGSLVQKKYQR